MSENFNLLSICGPDLIQYVEGIDFESFVNLKPHHIKEAIPNVIHRIMFENRFNNFLKSCEKTIPARDDDSQLTKNIDTNASGNSYNEAETPVFDESFDLINVTLENSPALLKLVSGPVKKANEIKTIQDIIDIPNIKLQIVITKYVDKEIPMENHHRTLVGKAIMHHLLVNNFERKIPTSEYIRLAELIVQLFPYENKGTFYTPAVKSSPAQGKLFAAYQNYRTELLQAGLIAKKELPSSQEEEEEELYVPAHQKSDALKLVLEHNDDFEQVKVAWKICYNERLILVNELSTFEYMRKFPALDQPNGFELLMLDADTLYPDKKSKLPEIAPKIVEFGSLNARKKKAPLELQNLIVEYDESAVGLDEESSEFRALQQITALKLLPHLMPNPKRKLSRPEVANFFCPHFKTAFEADSFNAKFNGENKNSTIILKPRLYFVGQLPQPCVTVVIGNKKYPYNTIEGFEIVFKSFLALKTGYPDETTHIWQFVQKELYEIELGQENKQIASVKAFIDDLKHFIRYS